MTLFSLFSILLASIFLPLVLFLVLALSLFSYLNHQITYFIIFKIAFKILFIRIFLIFFFDFFRPSQMTKYLLFVLFLKVNFNFSLFKNYLCWIFKFIQLIEYFKIVNLLARQLNFHYSN